MDVWMVWHSSLSPVYCPSPIFQWFLELFSEDFHGSDLRASFAGFVVGVTHEHLVPFFLVILPLQTHGKLFDLGVFGGARVLEVEIQDFRFPVTECVLGHEIWARGCPWGIHLPKIFVSICWVNRETDRWEVESWPVGGCSSRAA
jgi:hypothetical protein